MSPRTMALLPQPKSWSSVVAEEPAPLPTFLIPRYPVQTSICSAPAYTVVSKTVKEALDENEKSVKLITMITNESDGTLKTYEYVKRKGFPVMPRD